MERNISTHSTLVKILTNQPCAYRPCACTPTQEMLTDIHVLSKRACLLRITQARWIPSIVAGAMEGTDFSLLV